MKRTVVLCLFPDVEVLDFAGPFEVFAVTDELRGYDTFNVITVAETAAPIRARNGLRVLPDHTFATCPPPHLLIVPGGFGTRALLKNEPVLAWLRTQAASAELVMSSAPGPFCSPGLACSTGSGRRRTTSASTISAPSHPPRPSIPPPVSTTTEKSSPPRAFPPASIARCTWSRVSSAPPPPLPPPATWNTPRPPNLSVSSSLRLSFFAPP